MSNFLIPETTVANQTGSNDPHKSTKLQGGIKGTQTRDTTTHTKRSKIITRHIKRKTSEREQIVRKGTPVSRRQKDIVGAR